MTPEPVTDISSSVEAPIIRLITPGRIALLTGVIAIIPYLLTLGSTFGFVDKGELVAVASTLGISHPTGYPLITMLGFLFTKLLPVRPVLALNIMAAIMTATSAGMLTLLFDDLLRRISASVARGTTGTEAKKKKGKKGASQPGMPVTAVPDPSQRSLYAGLAALMVAFTSTWWDQGNSYEVYSLHTLMMPLVTFLFLRYIDEEAMREGIAIQGTSAGDEVPNTIGFTKRGIWFSVVLGLAFTNHLTTILLAPAFLVYYFWTLGLNGRAFQRWLYLAPGFVAGLLPYLYLPIRASMQPWFNWGDPDSLKRFIDHVSGKQYRVWMFQSGDVYAQQTAYFFNNLPEEFAYVGLIVFVLGIIQLARRNVRLSAFVGLMFIACIIYSGGFDIMEIKPYYLTAIFAVGIWIAMGLAWLHERFGAQLALPIAALLAVAGCAVNYHESNESGNYLVEDMTMNMLNTLPQNALVLSGQWDFWVAGSWYMQHVEGIRPDVTVVDPELLRRSWYLDQLEANYPELMGPIKPQVDAFREQLNKFEHDQSYDPRTIQFTYVNMINTLIDSNINKRPIHVTGEVDPQYSARFVRTPWYLTLRLMPDSTYLPQDFPNFKFRFWDDRVDSYAAKMYELYARAIWARAIYEGQRGNDSLARRYVDYLFTFDPGYTLDNVPDAPLNGEDQITGMIGLFDELRKKMKGVK